MTHPDRSAKPTAVILAITGGSGSGKTLIADALRTALRPHSVTVLREDDYYRDNRATPDFHPERFNFDDVAARDHGLLTEHLKALKAGLSIDMPRYDFVEHTRLSGRVTVEPTDIVIVEGTHVLHSADLRALYGHTIYLDVPDDIRLIRRILRDVAERRRSVETVTNQYLQTVRPMHYRFTEPTRIFADRVVAFDESSLTTAPAARMETLRDTIDEMAREILGKISAPPAKPR